MKGWLKEATKEKYPDPRRWDKLASLTTMAFREGHIPSVLTWTKMVLIPKLEGGYRGVGLVEVIWKVCKYITKNRLLPAITLHDE